MASTAEVKNSFSFVKGFVTEASALTFPENASLDEENFDLKIDGSRAKRLGMDYEELAFQHNAGTLATFIQSSVDTFLWETVEEEGGLDFLVVQIGSLLRFFDVSNTNLPLSQQGFGQTIELDLHLAGAEKVGLNSVSFASGKGLLFVNSRVTKPLYIRYNPINNLFVVSEYIVEIRDLDGVVEQLEIDERPAILTQRHEYNLRNQGWPTSFVCSTNSDGSSVVTTDPVIYTAQKIQVYPSNADLLYAAKITTATTPRAVNSYWPEELLKNVFGSTRAPRGKFILDAFFKDRSEESDILGLPIESIETRPEAVSFYSGRVFLGQGSTVYYSQVLTDDDRIGKCHSEADPAAEDVNDLIATDGGTIEIPDAGLIKQLLPVGDTLIVLATGGIWQVDGSRDPFSATNNRVNQISTIGVTTNKDGLLVENSILFTTPSGIYSIAGDNTTGELSVTNITESTINTYYLSTVQASTATVKGVYDPTTRKVFWLWTNEDNFVRFYDILILDMSLGAFHKYRINSAGTETPFLAAGFTTPRIGAVVESFNVIELDGDTVVDSLGNQVVINKRRIVSNPSSVKFLCFTPSLDPLDLEFTFSEFWNLDLVDWATPLPVPLDYEAFLLTGFEINGDVMRYKQAPIIQTVFNKTEASFIDNGSGGVEFDNPSSCKLQALWDWSDNSISGKITNEQEVYRFRRPAVMGAIGDPYIDGYPVVTSRTKIRGRGRSLHLKFRSPPTYDTELLGWALLYRGNDLP